MFYKKVSSLWLENNLSNLKLTLLVDLVKIQYACDTRTTYLFQNSLIIHEENTKKNHKRVESLYVIEISLDLHKL
jgi:hypothetical protein